MGSIRRCITAWLAVAALTLAGCTGMPVNTGSANRQIDAAGVDFGAGRKISASASGFQLLLLIPIGINDRHERAFQMLVDRAGGDYLTNLTIDESWTYALVGTVYKTTLSAMAYPRKPD